MGCGAVLVHVLHRSGFWDQIGFSKMRTNWLRKLNMKWTFVLQRGALNHPMTNSIVRVCCYRYVLVQVCEGLSRVDLRLIRYINRQLLQGSKDPNDRVLGPKYYNMNGIWAPKPYYLGPWTLIRSPYIPIYPPITPLKGPYYLGPWTLRVI